MGKTALSIGADTFAFFTRNPRGSKARETDPRDVEKFQALWETNRAIPLVAHAPYTLNPASTKEDVRTFARETIADDLRKMEMVPGNYYNMHPGNLLGQGSETGISLIAQCLNAVLDPALSTTLLLETMAGKGTEVGRTFGELRAIIDRLDLRRTIYRATAAYGHFGRTDVDLPWERLDMVDALRAEAAAL